MSLVIIIYAMMVLGGVGSVPGAVLGAVVLSILPELLRSPEVARLIFWGALVWIPLRLYGKAVAARAGAAGGCHRPGDRAQARALCAWRRGRSSSPPSRPARRGRSWRRSW